MLHHKPKPLWVVFSSRWGGAEQVAISDMVEMARANVPIELLCTQGSPVHAAALRHPHIHVHAMEIQTARRFDTRLIRLFRKLLETLDVNLVHLTDEKLLWSMVPAILDRPKLSLILSRYSPAEKSSFEKIKYPLLARVDYVTVLSEAVKAATLERFPIPEKKVKVINLGLDFSRFDPEKTSGHELRRSWGVQPNTLVIGSVGRLVPGMGQDTFLRAAAGLIKYSDYKLKFIVVGEDPLVVSEDYVSELQSLTKIFHLNEYIHFTSLNENLPHVMSAFDLFVMPGREEVPGLGALEALALEKPVVLSRVLGAEEIVGDRQQYGRLVRPEDAFDLQHQMRQLLEDPELRLKMGQDGRKHVLKNFDKQIRLNRTLEVYERSFRRRKWGRKSV